MYGTHALFEAPIIMINEILNAHILTIIVLINLVSNFTCGLVTRK